MAAQPLCAKCKSPTLGLVQGPPFAAVGAQPLKCSTCQGLWLQGPDVAKVMKLPIQPFNGDQLWVRGSVMDRVPAWCPLGHGLLDRARIELDVFFHLDRCTGCRGIWFDAGEWETLAQSKLLKKLDEFWLSAWQRRMRGANSRKAHLQRMEAKLGPAMYAKVMALAAELRGEATRLDALAFLSQEVQLKEEEITFDGLVTGSLPILPKPKE